MTEYAMQADRPSRPSNLVTLIVVCCIVLIGLDRTGQFAILRPLTTTLYNWALLLSAAALLLGVVHVFGLHMQRILFGRREWALSLALVVTLMVVFVAGIADPAGVASPVVEWIFDSVIAPIQATLFAILALFMAAAAYRFLRLGRRGGSWMLLGMLLVLVIQAPAIHELLPPTVGTSINWLLDYPAMAALRGAILGSALASLVVGIRFLVGKQ